MLLQTLIPRCETTLYQLSIAGETVQFDTLSPFGEGLHQVTRSIAPEVVAPADRSDPPTAPVQLIQLPDIDSEAAFVARQVRRWVENGGASEEVAIVGAQLDRYAVPLRRAFWRVGLRLGGEGISLRDDPLPSRLKALRRSLDGVRLRSRYGLRKHGEVLLQEAARQAWSTSEIEALHRLTMPEAAETASVAGQCEVTARVDELPLLSGIEFFQLLEQRLASRREPVEDTSFVSVLEVSQARSTTWQMLFLVGFTRGRFPQEVRADPLLDDRFRRRLQVLLPHLALKQAAAAEMLNTFQLLCRSAASLYVSWPAEDGKRRLEPSPWLCCLPQPVQQTTIEDRAVLGEAPSSTLSDWRQVLSSALPKSEEDAAERGPRRGVDYRARAHWWRWQRDTAPALPLSHLGNVGSGAAEQVPHVTVLEQLARCPWQAFLRRRLGLQGKQSQQWDLLSEPRLGDIVHRAMERLFKVATDPQTRRHGEAVARPETAAMRRAVRWAVESHRA